MANKNNNTNFKIVSRNRKAKFNYEIIETYEAGIILLGTEVKAIRDGHMSLQESYVGTCKDDDSLYLFNCDISVYKKATKNHDPKRVRKLLLHKKENIKLINAVQTKGMAILALTSYFNNNGILKITIALTRGKSKIDKRDTESKRDWDIKKQRILRNYNK